MGLVKQPVTSKEIVLTSLGKSEIRLGIIPAVFRPFDSAMEAAIPLRQTDILAKEILANNAKSAYESANNLFIGGVEVLRESIVDHLEVVFKRILRGVYADTILASYGIDRISRELPSMETPAEVKLVAGNCATGYARILFLTLPAILDFPASLIASRLAALITLETNNNSTLGLQIIADTNQASSVSIGITLVEDQRTQMDFNYRLLTASARRVEEGLWGVDFEATKEFTSLNIKSKMLVGGADAIAPTWRVGKRLTARGKVSIAGVTRTALAHGEVELDTTQEGDLCLFGSCPGCHDIVHDITVVAGEDMEFTFEFALL